MTFIPEIYLGKSRDYLSQRLNGKKVNGKKEGVFLSKNDIRTTRLKLENTIAEIQPLDKDLIQ